MLSLLSLLNVYKMFTTVTQTTEMKSSVDEKREKRSNQSENSPRFCLLALESLTTSLWPMELRMIIASATSLSCIVPAAFQAVQGPPLQPDGSGGGGPPSPVAQVDPSSAGADDPAFLLRHSCSPFARLSLLPVPWRLLLYWLIYPRVWALQNDAAIACPDEPEAQQDILRLVMQEKAANGRWRGGVLKFTWVNPWSSGRARRQAGALLFSGRFGASERLSSHGCGRGRWQKK